MAVPMTALTPAEISAVLNVKLNAATPMGCMTAFINPVSPVERACVKIAPIGRTINRMKKPETAANETLVPALFIISSIQGPDSKSHYSKKVPD